ncbi:uncharacterized protein LOC135810289 isoform X2 [Sycon ciliatum]|uniref:uncharacterized protein LOC135810289 isoform X2 n=1 Tax=Sycon ciliatum TaxID=27933 RepID=UPI0031F63BF7
MPSPKFHMKYHSEDVLVSSDGREMTRLLPSATGRKPTKPAAAAASQTQPAAKSQRDLEETVKKFADAVSEKGRAMYEIWALVFNVLHLLHSTGAERVRWTPPGCSFPYSHTLGVTMIVILCHCGEHLGYEMLQGLVDYILHFKTVDVNEEEDKTKANWTLLHHCAMTDNARLAKLLIERGACLNAQTSRFRWTPLHWAVMLNKINFVKVILSHDSDSVTLDTTLLDWDDATALDLAKYYHRDECVKLLTQHEADKAKKKIEKLVLSLDVD